MRFFLLPLFFLLTGCDFFMPGKQILLKVDGIKKAEYSFNGSEQLEEINTYFDDGKEDETIQFDYANGKIDRVYAVERAEVTDFYQNALKYNNELSKFGIKFCNPLVVPDDLTDFYFLLVTIQKFEKAKHNGLTVFWAKNTNANLQFVSPATSRFISTSSKIHYFEYGINAAGFLAYQVIQFDKSAMRITYQYKKGQLTHIGYSVIYSNGDTATTNRSYEYIDWDLLNTTK
ncbi:hypothetical protein NAT51_01760 [Flavobacterium amniphilum]|uniref:hypothetical protein n=1 Tax=Flavobacterium amniphilum TaxID=1834035 RepID=UPI00202ABE3E|nr:hypothetical protein [Flavobacterium amniphilum]MCL9804233.1 hypothetical protein [Flavobacterium amniphilum]